MVDIFEVLAKDHANVREILAQLELGATSAAGGTEQELAERKKLAQRLVIEESKHEAVEQLHFWPIVRDRLQHGSELADTAIGQEQQGKEVLDKLDKAQAGDPVFEKLVAEFISDGRKHIDFEERQVWPALRAALTPQESAELGRKFIDGKKTAPTRPHPRTPADPRVLKAAGPVAAATDMLRDVLTGRGEG